MAGLPPQVPIAIWLIASMSLIALIAFLIDAPYEVVLASLAVGLITAFIESINSKEK